MIELEPLKRLTLLIPLVVMGSTFGACKQNAEGDRKPSEELEAEVARILCEHKYECCPAEDAESLQQACYAVEEFEFSVTGNRIAEAVDSGDAVYSEERLVACLRALDALDCTGWLAAGSGELPVACTDFVKGKRENGDSCSDHFQCASGHCTEAGACAARGAEGEPCRGVGAEEDCEAELECRATSSIGPYFCGGGAPLGSTCVQGTDCDSMNCDEGVCTASCRRPFSAL